MHAHPWLQRPQTYSQGALGGSVGGVQVKGLLECLLGLAIAEQALQRNTTPEIALANRTQMADVSEHNSGIATGRGSGPSTHLCPLRCKLDALRGILQRLAERLCGRTTGTHASTKMGT